MAARCFHLSRLRERGVSDRQSQRWSHAVSGILLLHNSQPERQLWCQVAQPTSPLGCTQSDYMYVFSLITVIRQEQTLLAVVEGQKHMGDPSKTPITRCPV